MLGFHQVNLEAYLHKPIDAPLHIAEELCNGVADRRVIELPEVQFGLYSSGDLTYCEYKQERADRVSLLVACRRGYRITRSND